MRRFFCCSTKKRAKSESKTYAERTPSNGRLSQNDYQKPYAQDRDSTKPCLGDIENGHIDAYIKINTY